MKVELIYDRESETLLILDGSGRILLRWDLPGYRDSLPYELEQIILKALGVPK